MSKQLYADMVVNAVVAQDPTKPRIAKLALQRAVDDGGDTITIMLAGDKANNLMYMIPTSDIRQLLELEPQEDDEPEQPINILHQSKKTKHAHSHSKNMFREYDVYLIEKAVCGKSIRCGNVTVGNISDVTCSKCLEIIKAGDPVED